MENTNENEYPYPAPKGKVWKTNSMSEWILVDDPMLYIEGSVKFRRGQLGSKFTPKKKKRK